MPFFLESSSAIADKLCGLGFFALCAVFQSVLCCKIAF